MSAEIDVKLDGALLHVTLNRPNEGNRFTDAMAKELGEIIATAPDELRTESFCSQAPATIFCLGRAMMSPDAAGAAAAHTEALGSCAGRTK